MKKWIAEKLNSDKLWLSYWPNSFALASNAGMLAVNIAKPMGFGYLDDIVIFGLCFGVACSLRGMYRIYAYRKEQAQYHQTLDKFLMSLKPEIERIMNEEMNNEDRNEQDSLNVAQKRIQELIQSESDRRKIGLTVSNSDKT